MWFRIPIFPGIDNKLWTIKQDVHEQNIRKVENRAVLLSWLWKTNCTSTYKRLLLRRQETTTFEPVLLPGKCVFAISGGRQ